MPYHDEEYPGQPLWQSVLLFCCKGMIEGIMVILFFWLLVQVLFTKHLEVHLQILLLVGLIIFCLCLVLGCVLCWRTSQICPVKDKEPVTSAPASTEPVTFAQNPPPSAATTASRQQYEELDGDILEYPSTFTSPVPSESEFSSLPFSNQAHTASERKEQPKSYFSLRRLSTPPLTSPLYKPIDPSHGSLPSFPKLGLLSKTCKALQRRCTVTGDRISYNEHSRLTSPCAGESASCFMPEEPIPLVPLSYGSSCKQPVSPKPCLHFIMVFCPEQQTLTVTVRSLTGTSHRLEDVSVLGSLPPLYPCPIQASVQNTLSPEPHSRVLTLNVSSVKELQRCTLRIAVYTREPPNLRGATLGELEAECGGRDWKAGHAFNFMRELNPHKWKLKKRLISQDALVCKGLSCPPQIFISLQYQTLAHQIKLTLLRADILDLIHMPAAADYQVVINLHHEGVVISSRETEGGPCTVWNSTFLFDLPPGDIRQLNLTLEFVILQNQVLSEGKVLGRVFIGAEAADAGRAHWRDMCSLQVEQTRWHMIQPEPL
ncbi:hypothetical protein PAMP_019905 [Pampus punctatissimus]